MEATGRHSAPLHMHTVEGTDPHLSVASFAPAEDAPAGAPARPVLLVHGFASSTALNWEASGWVTALRAAGRRVIAVDLPGHGGSAAPEDVDSYTPSRIRADLLQIVVDLGARPLVAGDAGSGLDVIGYSLGSRLAWEFGATQGELVHRMVLGGLSAADPLAAFDLVAAQRYLADGTPIEDASTAALLKMAQLTPSNNIFALLTLVQAIKTEPFDPAEAVPRMPILLVAGDADERAAGFEALAALSGSASTHLVPGRNHANTVTSRDFKTAAIDFLAGP
ncbi:alpha/beta fold hydrolase [Arthrobacter sp. 35W]|uniref:alpha/beta fold hydrolase n=1 Tax=Arthrobacter sp. 35W TaxID=1132441 RepID=UPI0004257380|nr:alpha/beta fold hydrolase [Arthrobacter sp. 35W]